jgi:hypothetical protein
MTVQVREHDKVMEPFRSPAALASNEGLEDASHPIALIRRQIIGLAS